MKIECDELPAGVVRITLTGRMDLPGVDGIETALAQMMAAPRKAIIVDLSSVIFITSFGIRTLLSHAKALHRRRGNMVLLDPDPSVSYILETAGVDTVIPIYRDLQAAVAAAGQAWVSPHDQDF
jgi:anti-anti-sigma factor